MNDSLVSEDLFNKRFDICKLCQNLKDNICILCGCYMDSKCWVKYEACPIKKW